MKVFDWDEKENEWLKNERQISFEQAILCIEEGRLLDIIEHPNQNRYKGQRCYIVEIDRYAFVIPYIETDDSIFLKTIFPSRKYTSVYMHRRWR